MSSTPPGLSFEELVANLSLGDSSTPTTSNPSTVYYYESPTKRGYTTSWATAGSATQGVPNANVYRVVKGPKKRRPKAAAYVVFYGRQPGVYRVWSEANAVVSGCSGAIYRGYPTVEEATAAFQYAQARRWTRRPGSRRVSVSDAIAVPAPSQAADTVNPLHGSESLDDTWYVVYHGIQPGVYHSLLEAQLNTVGVAKSVYEGVEGKDAAFAAYREAEDAAETARAPPPPFQP
ncbi:hypothetical protein DFH06DRAFT_1337866 [Mycena polygramma]|nr:hypothetical protein DFH06DRAFT_1337866 [Mycena polygramma]